MIARSGSTPARPGGTTRGWLSCAEPWALPSGAAMSVIDSDQHLYEYRGLWEEYIDPAMRADAIQFVDDALGHVHVMWRGEVLAVADVQLPGETDAIGEVHGSPGLHVVDLAAFPSISAKHHTLTLMANADRIGQAIAARRTNA